MNENCPKCKQGKLSLRVVDESYFDRSKYGSDRKTFLEQMKQYYERIYFMSKSRPTIIVCDSCTYAKRK